MESMEDVVIHVLNSRSSQIIGLCEICRFDGQNKQSKLNVGYNTTAACRSNI